MSELTAPTYFLTKSQSGNTGGGPGSFQQTVEGCGIQFADRVGADDEVVFGEGEEGETRFRSIGRYADVFVARYEPDGRLAWVSTDNYGGGQYLDVAVLPGGGVVVTGWEARRVTGERYKMEWIVATYDPDRHDTIGDLLMEADKHMYADKRGA